MPFGVDTSGIPSIPGLDSVQSTPTAGISDSSKSLMTSLVEDRSSLFANPMVNVIDTTGSSLDQIVGQLGDIASGDVINPSITQGEATTFLAGTDILDAQTALGNFLSHTNRLSGVLKGAGIDAPGLEEIMSIGKQMNDYVNLLNAGSGCLSMIGGATGLFSGDAFNSAISNLVAISEAITRGVATIADIAETIAGLKDMVLGIISKDSQFLQNCVNQLQAAALALALEYVFQDPCAKFLLETVQNQNPGGIMTKLVAPITL
jgi:hypothetical protein